MQWIVLGQERGKIKLVSKRPNENEVEGLLPKGSYLTIEQSETNTKFILRVDDSYQNEIYKPSPMIVDMDLSALFEDRLCQNIIHAYEIENLSSRNDGLITPVLPQSLARRSSQDEIDIAFGGRKKGPLVFPATVHAGKNQLLVDDELNYITVRLPEEIFYHQIQICGKTGSGKTVASKYLAQYFVEEMNGAVLAINVKDTDFLKMDRPSNLHNESISKEWESLNKTAKRIDNYTIYYPSNTSIDSLRGVSRDNCVQITLDVQQIEPEALTGLLQNITDIGAQVFPDIFRLWQVNHEEGTFNEFVEYFANGQENPTFDALNSRGDTYTITIHKATFNNILRNLSASMEFFDNEDAVSLDYDDILSNGKLSVINVAGDKGIQFGSILLRHLLKRIVSAKSNGDSSVPVLVIIDEVHQFYHTDSSREALGVLDTICRTGRSQEIGVIFSSQNQDDIPKGLSQVINTKIYFRSDGSSKNLFGISSDEISSLKAGYAVANIHELPQLRVLKFPLALAGVVAA
jgi:DNA helicase HerA-like ATPase